MNQRQGRFFLWNDMHVCSPDRIEQLPFKYSLANEKAEWARDGALGKCRIEPPDFILCAGDLVQDESQDDDGDYRHLRKILLDPVKIPFLPCLGNHENTGDQSHPDPTRLYDRYFGPAWHNYVFTAAGFGFIVLDTSNPYHLAGVPEFLARAAGFLSPHPLFIVTHTPLVPMRDPRALEESFGYPAWKIHDPALLQAVERLGDRIIAVFCGHLHLTAVRRVNGIDHVMPAGTYGTPADFAAVDLYNDRVTIQMHPAPDHLLNPEGNIHGRPRHAVDYTDPEHPTPHAYLWGNPNERNVTIPLTGQKIPVNDDNSTLAVYHESAPDHWVKM